MSVNKSATFINRIAAPVTVSPSSLSGYTGITDFTFTSHITGALNDNIGNKVSKAKLVWDFGDGTSVTDANVTQVNHIYNYPGIYTVEVFYYDGDGESYLGSLTKNVTAYNYKETELSLMKGVSSYSIKAGDGNLDRNSIDVYVRTTWQDYNPDGNTIYFAASGSKSDIYDNNYKYAFLLPFRSFYTLEDRNYKRSNKLTVNLIPKYFELDSDGETPIEIDQTGLTEPRGTFLYAESVIDPLYSPKIYYFDDLPSTVRLIAALDTSKNKLPDFYVNNISTDINLAGMNFMESNIGYFDIKVQPAKPETIVFTSTGHKDMRVHNRKIDGSNFQVFAAVGDVDGNILKYYPEFTLSEDGVKNGTANTFNALIYNLSSFNASYLPPLEDPQTHSISTSSSNISSLSTNKFPYSVSSSCTQISSFGYLNITPFINDSTDKILGVSARPTTNILDTDIPLISGALYYTVDETTNGQESKHNEDFNYQETLENYRLQQILTEDGDSFFGGILGKIVGTNFDKASFYGKNIYEKIANFVENSSDVDECNIDKLQDLYKIFNEEPNFSLLLAPPELKRLYDFLTIKVSKLVGGLEKHNQNFDTFYTQNSAYGVNLDKGDPISVETYTVTAGTNFVARQRFNNEYILIEPMKVPTSTINKGTTEKYPLSCFGTVSNWGWPLDETSTGANLSLIYDFYPFINRYNNKKESVIDYDNVLNDTPYSVDSLSAWNSTNKTQYKIIDKKLRDGLNI